ncbi:hypothetical protein HanXRQr2_Chr14g0626611 [Helianthus annuus]|uniref:Uncharacterized protein n=1 Tax=Helianthus annuus TaxID=4232 RepID=A0A251SF38_HELAN|nr:uncharacterized protein LOC110908267 [Helianthus annuus]XP_022008875.1 uncharacterized protein LOC110908267 [Helianthus annuus]XP_022008876.1 uncharacterized protein LOC110908268 [Helianthus annuus]XP_022008877.1 uncharacterized protein LOC110908268 [Helianthus annuus]KAF5767626.1 hypothetical protein HanXRQr2_Chr14g0626601 [Helianthus annuus]KAF5767627.1 hypothetical protein HanXRQr2_Chr14g0626611 [Helianthus annuus]KAJ0466964.1 hypothetical protein HanIR_Chr14g0678001 [Helianthus annuus]
MERQRERDTGGERAEEKRESCGEERERTGGPAVEATDRRSEPRTSGLHLYPISFPFSRDFGTNPGVWFECCSGRLRSVSVRRSLVLSDESSAVNNEDDGVTVTEVRLRWVSRQWWCVTVLFWVCPGSPLGQLRFPSDSVGSGSSKEITDLSDVTGFRLGFELESQCGSTGVKGSQTSQLVSFGSVDSIKPSRLGQTRSIVS